MIFFCKNHVHPCLLCLGIVVLVAISGCVEEKKHPESTCLACHEAMADSSHQMSCTVCHQGNAESSEIAEAHVNLIAQPAHPDNISTICAECHREQADSLPQSLHYTQKNLVNLVRKGFGAKEDIPNLLEIPVIENPETPLELSEDLLRRRCLRCHLFSSGDEYSATKHGTGCAACHLNYQDGELSSHAFSATPQDTACLSCHYGNRVGFDYYGRFEHDFNHEYRTPYSAADFTDRPYGVDYHDLAADVHQRRGMLCVDCHGAELMTSYGSDLPNTMSKPEAKTCSSCHEKTLLEMELPSGVTPTPDGYSFTSKSGSSHALPVMKNRAHEIYQAVSCQVCHAQWSFNDTGTNLLRSDLDDYYSWDRLTVQGSKEVETLLEHNLDYDKDELPPEMSDKITGDMRLGIWYKGFVMRRWEEPLLGRADDGTIQVVRPKLDISLSWIDEDEEVHFDSIPSLAPNQGKVPYTPHTTGPAGIYYEQRLRDFLRSEEASQDSK
ncbi:hypothetical protein [Desulfosediminicola sp.]|uniref:hypothetical protein n=1 Tax=Desulfosediminicola sp. TaxID=2886825 RepID=UPI003AF2DA91